jgi:hypothetical protein
MFTLCYIYNKIQYLQASFNPGFVQQIMPYLLGTIAVLDTWTVVHMTAAKLEGQVPGFISPRNRVAQLYPRAMSSLFVASWSRPTVEIF